MNKTTRRTYAFLLLVLLLVVPFSLHAQEGGKLSLQLTPGVNLPLGDSSTAMFSIGGGAELTALYSLPFAPIAFARASLDYSILPTVAQTNLSLITLGAGVGLSIDPVPWLNLQLSATGGYGLGIYAGQFGGSAYVSGEAAVNFIVAQFLGLGLGASYRHYFSQPTPFYQGIRVNLGTFFRLGVGPRKPLLEIPQIRFDPVFPVFYKYYDDHPVGSVLIRNSESGTINDVKVSFFVNQYMEKPKQSVVIAQMKPGEQKEVALYALFTDRVLGITEGTKVAAVVQVAYRLGEAELSLERPETLRLYDRNAMTWDDDRKASAFVTAKDPEILKFSKNVAGLVREHGSKAANLNFRIAMGLFEAMGWYGLNYVVDPKSPYTEFSGNTAAVDYLQFPVQTMSYKAGDCDDLSILYCALLESVGIETAFITAPGHISMAFSLGMPPEEAKKLFLNPQDLIYVGNTAWVPVEITMVQAGFLQAWSRGAKEWREEEEAKKAGFYPIHEAWTSYEPVGLPESGGALAQAVSSEVMGRYSRTLTSFVEREIAPRVTELEGKIRTNPDDPKLLNKLGVLYAQYGILDKATARFEQAAARQHVPAVVNLGNTSLLQNRLDKALEYYRQAERNIPEDVNVLVGLAKVYYGQENQTELRKVFDRLQRKSPDVADRFSYMVGGTTEASRASAAVTEEIVLWARED